MIKPVPYLMENKIQNYDWGTKGKNAIISNLLSLDLDENIPCAELWMGAHRKASSAIRIDDKLYALTELIEKYPGDILGSYVLENFEGNFPFLLKILSAFEALSIQVHPNKSQAKLLHSKDPENYPDDNHKPEIAIAINELTALVGFKSIDEICNLLKEFPEILSLTEHISVMDMENAPSGDKETQREFLRSLYSGINNSSVSDTEKLSAVLKSITEKITAGDKPTDSEKLFLELQEKYKNDVGLFSVLLLDLKKLNKGEAVYLEAGIPHAYIKGDIIECMANSDNVIRAGLTPKFKDIPSLIEMVDYEPQRVNVITPVMTDSEKVYKTDVREFEISVIEGLETTQLSLQTSHRPEILFLLEGSAAIKSDNEGYELQAYRGNAVFIPALMSSYQISLTESAVVIRATVP